MFLVYLGIIENDCNVAGIPWFSKALGEPTTDYIELRVCADEDTVYEDAPVSFYKIHVK